MSDFSTYAFITADGEWHETGRMGWFGMDDATRSSWRPIGKRSMRIWRKPGNRIC